MSSSSRTPTTADMKTIQNFLNLQPVAKVQESKTAFNRKIIKRTETLSKIDKTLVYGCIASTVLVSIGMIVAFRVLNTQKLRQFTGFKWVLGVGGVYAIGKSIYELPTRMAFADYLSKERLRQEQRMHNQQNTVEHNQKEN